MDVSLIILNYKTRGLINEQLKNFFARPLDLAVETIVADNHSVDGIAAMLSRTMPHVRCIEASRNRGYAAGNNLGMRHARGTYYLIANPDIVMTPELVLGLYRFMEEHPQVGICGPRLVYPDGTLQYSCWRFPNMLLPLYRRTALAKSRSGRRWLDFYFMKEWDHRHPRDVDWLLGACLMVRASCIPKVGMLDERFFLYLEDTDWCRRFWERGYGVWYVPTVSAVHLLRRSSEGSLFSILFNKLARAHLLSFFKYLWKHRGKPNPHHQTPAAQDY